MKKQNIIIIVSALVMAGCAHHERENQQARYDETISAPSYGGSEGSSATATEASQSATTPSTSEGKNPSDARTITSGAAQEQSRIYSNSTSQAEGAASSPGGTVSEPAKNEENKVEQKDLQGDASANQSLNSTADQSTTPPSADSLSVNVQGITSADQPVAQKIIEKIRVEPSLAGVMPLVRINVEDGKATLQGAVKSEEQKEQLEKTVQDVSGVTSVDNQLKVSATLNDSTNP